MSTLKKVNKEIEKLQAEIEGNNSGIRELELRNQGLQALLEAYENQKKLLKGLGEQE